MEGMEPTSNEQEADMAEGKKNRKYSRNRKAPAMVRYKAENRAEANKKRRIKSAAKCAHKTMKVPRGMARAKARGFPCVLLGAAVF